MVKYENDYLMEVSLRMDFLEEINLNQSIADAHFKPILKERFPTAAFEKDLLKDGEYHGPMWIYQNENKQIQLNPSSLELVYNQDGYNSKEELIDDVKLIEEVLNENEIEETHYLSLRFINEIRPKFEKIENLSEWINPQLINFDFKSGNSQIIRGMSRFEYKIDDGFFLNFQFGQYNANYPLPYIKDNFILDYEARIKYADTRYLKKYTIKMHQLINKFFQDSIGDGLREDMGEIDEEETNEKRGE